MTSEPVTFVIERRHGVESAGIYVDKLPERLTRKGSQLVYALRLDKLPPEQQQFWLSQGCSELLDVYRWLRGEGTLPPANLAEPPAKTTEGRKGALYGDRWQPPARYWEAPDFPRDRRPVPPLAARYDAQAYIGPRGRYLHLAKGPPDE